MTGEPKIDAWLQGNEDEHLEFKEAKQSFHFEKLVKYCAALANEGGGSIILGVTDKRPRCVVGTNTFQDLERTKAGLIEKLRLRIEIHEVQHRDGRVLVFMAPSRPIGMPIPVEGAYWMRAGENLVPMTPDLLQRIFAEAGPDFSAEICPHATLSDLDPAAIEVLRHRWAERSGNAALARMPADKLLRDAELVLPGGLTYAALVLLGTREALGRLLPQAEVVFEYRSSSRPGPASQREEFRRGFLTFYDRIWELVNLRNDLQHVQERFVMHPVPTFSEIAFREAMLNAVGHRDYRHGGSVFVLQFPRRIEIVSPGGFPPGITPDNILDQQFPRNRRIAETFARCGLVERSGQGADRIVEECVRHGKPLPDYTRSDEHRVALILNGEIQDENFVRLIERVGNDRLDALDPHDFLILGLVASGQRVRADLRPHVPRLMERGLLERTGRGKPVLAKRLYCSATGSRSTKVAERDVLRARQKAELRAYIADHAGVSLKEIVAAFPMRTRNQVQGYLKQLRSEETIHPSGPTRSARWFAGPRPKDRGVSQT
jgi:ATP-dependent DNA helicase RecG